ncbi:MAG: DUF3553 domain-containing protein [Phycisphaerales bacterium]
MPPTTQHWSYGDRVVHSAKPEWGHGVVTSASATTQDGVPCQRLTIRFDRAGIKVLSTAFAELKPAKASEESAAIPAETSRELLGGRSADPGGPVSNGHGAPKAAARSGGDGGADGGADGGWLGSIKPVSPSESLLKMPDSTTDPFSTLAARLNATLSLYKFTDAGASLLDWAAAQTGLKDPLSVFSRHELEQVYRRFTFIRDDHLKKLMNDARRQDPEALFKAARLAPPAGQQAMRRIDASR